MTQKKQVLQGLQVLFLLFNCQTPVQKISIDALTSIVFGYKELEKIEEEEKEIFSAEFKEEISKLIPFSPVFINEIV